MNPIDHYPSLIEFLQGRPLTKNSRCGNCQLCGIWEPCIQKDHIIPTALGGLNHPTNWQYICGSCHHRKTTLERSRYTTGRIVSAETRRKMSIAQLGKHPTLEIRQILSLKAKGHKKRLGAILSAETRQKISLSRKAWVLNHANRCS